VSVHVLQVTLPDTLKGRYWNSTTIVHTGSTVKKLVNYGGTYEFPRNLRDASTYIPVAETTVIEIGKGKVTFCTIYTPCCILDFMTLATYDTRMIHFRRAMEVMTYHTCSLQSVTQGCAQKFELG